MSFDARFLLVALRGLFTPGIKMFLGHVSVT